MRWWWNKEGGIVVEGGVRANLYRQGREFEWLIAGLADVGSLRPPMLSGTVKQV